MTAHFRTESARPGQILLLHHDLHLRVAVERAVGKAAVVRCRSWGELIEQLRGSSPRAVVIADPLVPGRKPPEIAGDLARLRRGFPSTRVLVAVDSSEIPMPLVLRLGQMGVAEILDLHTSLTSAAIRTHLSQIPPDAFRTLVDGSALDDLTGRGRLLLERAAEIAARGGYPRDLAGALGMSPMTLRRWMGEAGLPNPRQLFRWLRVLLASSLLDDPGRTVLDAALAAGYSNASGLRRATNAVLELPPSHLREKGAYDYAMSYFLEDPALMPEERT